jgi:hypothetical protein
MKYEINGKEYHIFFQHDRGVDKAGNISNYGGQTIAFTTDRKTKQITARGIANCSEKDIYSKKLGRVISAGRLFKELGIPTKYALDM